MVNLKPWVSFLRSWGCSRFSYSFLERPEVSPKFEEEKHLKGRTNEDPKSPSKIYTSTKLGCLYCFFALLYTPKIQKGNNHPTDKSGFCGRSWRSLRSAVRADQQQPVYRSGARCFESDGQRRQAQNGVVLLEVSD